jgi:ubiquitin C-terminal hydrolase
MQDAHEFLNYLLNTMAEILEAQDKAAGKHLSSSSGTSSTQSMPLSPFAAASISGGHQPQQQPGAPLQQRHLNGQQQQQSSLPGSSSQQQQQPQQPPQHQTWVHEIFQGWLVSETRCLQFETTTRREESFMDLSLEIDHNTSLTSCLKQFRWAALCY